MLALAETSRCTSSATVSRRRTSAIVMLHAACEKGCRSSFCRAGANEVVASDKTRDTKARAHGFGLGTLERL